MGNFRTKEDDVVKISLSVYIPNFPDNCSAKDLFHHCKKYGHVVDPFIPNKRSKMGKRFGFMRFINVFNEDRLVNNLCTVWIDRHKIHANLARFKRPYVSGVKILTKNKGSKSGSSIHSKKKKVVEKGFDVPNSSNNSFAQAVKGDKLYGGVETESGLAVVLDDECLADKDLSKSLLGRVKELASLANLKVDLCNEGFVDIKIVYMGELWVMLEFGSQEMIKLFSDNLSVRASETPGWVPDFTDESDEDEPDDEMSKDGGFNDHVPGNDGVESDREEVPKTLFDKEEMVKNEEMEVGSIKYPPGFTPLVWSDVDSKHDADVNVDNDEEVKVFSVGKDNDRSCDNKSNNCSREDCGELAVSTHFKNSIKPRTGGSIVGVLDELYAKSDSVGNSRGILCVWDSNSFSKHNVSVSDYFVMVRGVWRSSGHKWNGDVVIMGDFNEVHYMSDRFGSTFNAHGASLFNLFISSSGLMEVNLGGSAYTWCHKSASKMSKLDRFLVSESLMNNSPNLSAITLERYLSDHRPILLRELNVDYGPTPFRFFHHWIEMEALFISAQKDVDSRIDNGHATEEDTKSRVDLINKVKSEFQDHFSKRFCMPDPRDVTLQMTFPNTLSLEQQSVIECDVTNVEIKNAVWDCGTDKALGLDGFSFGFYRRFWYLIEKDVCDAVKYFFTHDDAVFVGQWSEANINSVVYVLECFNLVSGLRINMRKSKIMGMHVNSDKVNMVAKQLRCLVLKAPFIYLGSTVGGTMSNANAWSDVVDRVRNRLSKWKMKTLSIGGRLTLLKSVLGSMPIFHMSMFKVPIGVLISLEKLRSQFFNGYDSSCRKASWVKWKLVLASKKRGGLGVSSLYALNRGLLFKWLWRFYSQDSSLWTRVIKAIHGVDGKVDVIKRACNTSCWLNIIHEVRVLKNRGIDLKKYMHIKLESSKLITVGTKLGDSNVTDSFRRTPRGGAEQQQLDEMVTLINSISLAHMADSLFNVSRMGICIDSIRCVLCDEGVETSNHLFFSCSLVRKVYRLISCWWDVPEGMFENYEGWLSWMVIINLPHKIKLFLKGVVYVMWWLLWNFRNKTIFEANDPSKATLFDNVVSKSFIWCRHRCKASFTWNDWLKNPNLISL
uniref:RNA-directed DNA polymerase, eukaryota, reverse transcriptase zinc-binding domain protein n=1 Tax=Tanacetum cinerariifolium TaxID=118510 RepID=A0A6L2MHU8_TANCI|nr:RNA-directed DNA polymerase, eukaryota, reverse transcriptase zinc-binding domain protein [Tanacetum cinerariifolium]